MLTNVFLCMAQIHIGNRERNISHTQISLKRDLSAFFPCVVNVLNLHFVIFITQSTRSEK